VQQGINGYIQVNTNDGSESVSLGNADNNPAINLLGTGQVTVSGNLDATNGLDVTTAALTAAAALTVSGGAFTFTGSNIDLDPTGTFSLDMDAAQTATITLADDLADAFVIADGGGATHKYIDIDTTNVAVTMTLGNTVNSPTIQLDGTSFNIGCQINLDDNLSFSDAYDILVQDNTADALQIRESGANIYFEIDTTDASPLVVIGNTDNNPGVQIRGNPVELYIVDNVDNAFLVLDGTNHYIEIDTTNASEVVKLGNATTNPDYEFLGSGSVTAKTIVFDAEYSNGSLGATPTIDWGNGQKQHGTLSANATFTFTAPDGPCNLVLRISQGAAAGYTITWPSSVKWPGGTAPNLNPQTGGEINVFSFYYNGTDYYAQGALDFS
jgi:hypothetical protein